MQMLHLMECSAELLWLKPLGQLLYKSLELGVSSGKTNTHYQHLVQECLGEVCNFYATRV